MIKIINLLEVKGFLKEKITNEKNINRKLEELVSIF